MKIVMENSAFNVQWRHLHEKYKLREDRIINHETICYIYLNDSNVPFSERVPLAVGVSYTSNLDNFCKDKGRKISLKRALQHAGFNRATRTQFWKTYINRKDKVCIQEST